MSDKNDIKPNDTAEATEGQQVSTSRRNFTKAGLLATPVLMTVASKPAWATVGRQCTVSVLMSGDGSIPIDWDSCRSCSPRYWHHESSCWSTAGMAGNKRTTFGEFFVGSFNPDHFYNQERNTLNTPLEDLFPGGGPNENKFKLFARAATASYLDAMALGHLFGSNIPSNIPTASNIQSMIAQVFFTARASKPDTTNRDNRKSLANDKANFLATYYDEGSEECILPNSGDCPPQGFNS